MDRIEATDAKFMRRALELAQRAKGKTSPNPMVGALVVKGNRIAGEGYHHRAGAAHAEIEALSRAGQRAQGSTLYVTLEPCAHYGRTPPCCDAIITAGISRVVIGARDPNPLTNGRSMAKLRKAGIRTAIGVLASEVEGINAPFNKTMRLGLPMVVAKVGQSLDGKIATQSGESRWITSKTARRLSHGLRSSVDAIIVGITTICQDDPRLTVRGVRTAHKRSNRPVRVIVDSTLRIPLTARCLSKKAPGMCMVATTSRDTARRETLRRRGAEVLVFRSRKGRVPLRLLCRELASRGLQSVLIEGGGEVLASAFEERIVDRIMWMIAPTLIGGRDAPGSVGGKGISRLASAVKLTDVTLRRLGPDICVEARVKYPKGTRGGYALR